MFILYLHLVTFVVWIRFHSITLSVFLFEDIYLCFPTLPPAPLTISVSLLFLCLLQLLFFFCCPNSLYLTLRLFFFLSFNYVFFELSVPF